jgi:hypothetical protein
LLTRTTIDLYFRVATDSRTEHIDDYAIDAHPAVDDPIFGLAPGTEPKFA